MKKKNVLITGAAGFIGSHLTERCVQLGYNVKAFVHYNARGNQGWLEDLPCRPKINVVSGDIRDFDSVMSSMKGCDEVYHLAALIGIPYSYVSPLAYIKTNIEGTYNVLQSAKILGVGNVVVTSTSETFGSAQYVPIDEKHPLVAQSPYAATKVAADQLALSFYRSFDLPVKVARPFNAYGPRQSARAIIPSIILQILSGKKKIKLGNLHTKRDFSYVLDTVNGFLAIAGSRKCLGQVTNIGMNEEISIRDLVKRIAGLMHVRVMVEEESQRLRPERSEVTRLKCDNTQLLRHTSWKPEYNLEKGLKQTIDWLKENLHLYKANAYAI